MQRSGRKDKWTVEEKEAPVHELGEADPRELLGEPAQLLRRGTVPSAGQYLDPFGVGIGEQTLEFINGAQIGILGVDLPEKGERSVQLVSLPERF